MSRSQSSVLKIVESIVKDNMAVRAADAERIDRYPAEASCRPRDLLEGKLESPFCCWYLRIDFLEIDVRGNDPTFEDKDRFDDTVQS